MAEGGGLFRRVRLLLDKRSTQEVEKGAKEALDRGTDPKKPTANLSRTESSLGRLKAVAIKVGAAMAAIWVVRRVFEYGKAIFQLGADVRAVGSQFATVFDSSSASMQAWLDDFRRIAGLTNREAQKLSASSGSMARGFGMTTEQAEAFSKEILSLSGDLASFNNIPTAQAAQLVQSALIGNTEAARSLGVSFTALDVQQRALANTGKQSATQLTQTEKALAGLQVMTERAGPQIGDLARTQNDADNQAKQLAASFTQLKETLAAAVVGGTAGSTIFGDVRDIFEDLTGWVERNAAEIGHWSSVFITAIRAIGTTAVGIFDLVRAGANSIASYIVLSVSVWQEAFARGADGVGRLINGVIEGLNKIPGVDIDFRIAGVNVEHFEAQRRAAADDLKGELGGVADALVKIGDGWVAVGRHAMNAERAQESAASTDQGSGLAPLAGRGGDEMANAVRGIEEELAAALERASLLEEALPGFDREAAQATAYQHAIEALIEAGMDPLSAAVVRHTESLQDLIDTQEALEDMARRTERTAEAMTASFDPFFSGLAANFGDAAGMMDVFVDGVRGVGGAIVGELTEGHAEMHMAEGAGMLARGTWPPNPAALLAASRHFAAAALFKALPGIVAGGGGGFGGGRLAGAGAPNTPTSLGGDRIGNEVHIYIDPLNPQNPVYQDNVHTAARLGEQRNGATVKVHTRSGTRGETHRI